MNTAAKSHLYDCISFLEGFLAWLIEQGKQNAHTDWDTKWDLPFFTRTKKPLPKCDIREQDSLEIGQLSPKPFLLLRVQENNLASNLNWTEK